jgi:hypothetical protein
MAGSSFKVALVASRSPLSGACPIPANAEVRDFVGVGSSNATTGQHFALATNGQTKGSYYTPTHLVAYAKTLGYQEYDGLGWWAAIIQELADESATRKALGLPTTAGA